MACVGCGKPLKRETMCKTCAVKLWHEVDNRLEKYAAIYFKRDERLVKHIHTEKYLPLKWYGEDYTDELTEITDADREEARLEFATVEDVTFYAAYYQKERLERHKNYKKELLRDLNRQREEDDKKCPKCSNMKRKCRVCKVKKPLNIDNFYWKRFSCAMTNEYGRTLNDLEKQHRLGCVCRECFTKQIEAKKELTRIKINIGGFKNHSQYLHGEKMMLLSMGRTLVSLKKEKRRLKHEPNHADVYGKQQPHEENLEGRV